MQSSSPPKFSLDTLMSTVLPSLDMNVPVDDAPKKFKRSRPPPVAAPPAPAPSQAQTPAHIYKSPLPTDMAIAAAAAFRSDTAAPSPAAPSPMSTSTSAATAATSTNTNKSKSKWNRKRKAGKQGNSGAKTTNPDLNPTALMPETAGSSTNQSGSNNKKSKIYHNAKHQPKNKPAIELDVMHSKQYIFLMLAVGESTQSTNVLFFLCLGGRENKEVGPFAQEGPSDDYTKSGWYARCGWSVRKQGR
ncbi:hypothetical protein EDD21DRAFT_148728 [Dissophora ornata]|nr:hypothetical protein EDD21DRAFT_148728 [Dissophora ornata]